MATNMDEEIDEIVAHVDTGCTALVTDGQNDTSDTGNGQSGISRRTRLVNLGRLLLHLVCLGYSFYLIWLLAYLKDNNYCWFLSLIPINFNFSPFCMLCFAYLDNMADLKGKSFITRSTSCGVVVCLMVCFTMLTREAYYHRQPDEFIGPRFIIVSLEASIILILLDFVLQRLEELESLLDCKDYMTRMLLDFVDIFNMVEILSVNVCVGVGSYITEDSSTERAIQAFCTMSFMLLGPWNPAEILIPKDNKNFLRGFTFEQLPRLSGEDLYSRMTIASGLLQNLPFLVIRIVVWAQYKLYCLGFLVKNLTVIVLVIAILGKIPHNLSRESVIKDNDFK